MSKLESVRDDGDFGKIHDVVALCSIALCKHERFFVDDSACEIYDLFKASQASARGHYVVYDCDFLAFDEVCVVLGQIQGLLVAGGDGFHARLYAVLHVEFFGFSAYGVISLSQFASNDVAKLQAFRFRRDDDVATREKFGKFLSAMLGHRRVAVEIEKANADSVGKRKYGEVCFEAFDVNLIGSVHFYPPKREVSQSVFVVRNPYII